MRALAANILKPFDLMRGAFDTDDTYVSEGDNQEKEVMRCWSHTREVVVLVALIIATCSPSSADRNWGMSSAGRGSASFKSPCSSLLAFWP